MILYLIFLFRTCLRTAVKPIATLRRRRYQPTCTLLALWIRFTYINPLLTHVRTCTTALPFSWFFTMNRYRLYQLFAFRRHQLITLLRFFIFKRIVFRTSTICRQCYITSHTDRCCTFYVFNRYHSASTIIPSFKYLLIIQYSVSTFKS